MKTLIKILVIVIASSCAIHRVNRKEFENLTVLGHHLSWIINDSYYHADVSSFETHRFGVIEYEKAYGTLYVYVKSNEEIYQVIPIVFDSTIGNDTNFSCKFYNKKFTNTKDGLVQLKLIPIFAEERMPGDLVNSVYLNDHLIHVQRRVSTNVYWGIEEQ